ncbi:MAG: hypothetical protein AAB567_03515 [Patescibacteria group bacterium]
MGNRPELNDAVKTEVFVGPKKAVQFDESIFPLGRRDRNPQFDGFTTFAKQNDVVFMFAGRSCATEKDQFRSFYEMMLASVEFFADPQQQVEPSVIDTNAWHLYTNEDFGYSLKIPPEFHERWKDLHGSSKTFEVYSSASELSKPAGQRYTVADLDVRIFKYGDPGFKETKEEAKILFEKLKSAKEGEELSLGEEGLLLKVRDINLDGLLAPQVLVGGSNTYATFYAGETYALQFEFEANRRGDLEKYKPFIDASLSTFRFNEFIP